MKQLFSSLRWLVFLLLIWLAATATRWILPAIALVDPDAVVSAELVVTQTTLGEDGACAPCTVWGDVKLPDGELISRELAVDADAAAAIAIGDGVPVEVNLWPSESWFEGTLRRVDHPRGVEARRQELAAALRGPAVAVALWAFLALTVLLVGILRRAVDAGVRDGHVIELDLNPAAGGCGTAGVAVGLASGISLLLGWSGGVVAPIAVLAIGLLAWSRGSVRVDRRAGTLAWVAELGPVRRTKRVASFAAPREVLVRTKPVGKAAHLALVLVTEDQQHELGAFASGTDLGADASRLAGFLGVGARVETAVLEGASADAEDADDEGAGDDDELKTLEELGIRPDDIEWESGRLKLRGHRGETGPAGASAARVGAATAPLDVRGGLSETSSSVPSVRVVGGDAAIPRAALFGCAGILLFGGLALFLALAGVDTVAVSALSPRAARWPLAGTIRATAAKALVRDGSDQNLLTVLRFLHTADPGDPAWRPTAEALAAELEVELADSPFASSQLEPIDEAAAQRLGLAYTRPAGAFEWWSVDPEWQAVVEAIAGTDARAGLEAWASIGPPTPPTFEAAMLALGPALDDLRPIAFAVVASDGQGTGMEALPEGAVAAATTVGEAIAVRLALYGAFPAVQSGDPVEAWRSLAASRGYPAIWPPMDGE